jgi:predicted cupin superfamily sugar epimerase
MSTKNAGYWIEKLGLQKHPGRGYYKETYRSDEEIAYENFLGGVYICSRF